MTVIPIFANPSRNFVSADFGQFRAQVIHPAGRALAKMLSNPGAQIIVDCSAEITCIEPDQEYQNVVMNHLVD